MITDYYEDQLKTLHAGRADYKKWGSTSARNFGDEITKFMNGKVRIKSVLDFGSGKGSMKLWLDEHLMKKVRAAVEIYEYDPGLPGKDILPSRQFDLIISSDVLEHVEPEMIEETIAWMQSHSDRFLYHHIACDPAGITLPDGRNVHLITEGLDWWMDKFTDPNWQFMEVRDCWQQKRGYFRHHIHVRLDKCSAGPPRYVPSDYQA